MREIDEAKPEYDFSKGVRGKHAERHNGSTDEVVLKMDPIRRNIVRALCVCVMCLAGLMFFSRAQWIYAAQLAIAFAILVVVFTAKPHQQGK